VPKTAPGLVRCSSGSIVGAFSATLGGLIDTLAKPKSRIFACYAGSNEDIRGLDVPMNYAVTVRRVQCIGNLNADIKHGFDVQRSAIYQSPERLPLKQFHCNERSPRRRVDFVDGANVWVVQGGSRFGLSLESAEGLNVVG
jgi:hypothetical protein